MNARLAHAILAGAQVVTAGSALADLIGGRWAAFIALLVGAGQAGVAVYQYTGAPAKEAAK